MAVWEALQIAVKRREAKSKGEKERYKHLNPEFQRIARRDKKVFLNGQCKEMEGIRLSEISQTEKGNTICYYLYVESKKKQTSAYNKKETYRYVENKLVVTSGNSG